MDRGSPLSSSTRLNVPLVPLGSLMLYASRHLPVLPNMGLVLRFTDPLTEAELRAEADRLAASPFGLGRRLQAPLVPGARPRWVAAPESPGVEVHPPRRTAREVGSWLADELSVRHDPSRGPGWRLAATTDPDGATIVALVVNHLFGTGRDIVTTLYGGELLAQEHDEDLNGAAPATVRARLEGELRDAAGRLGAGSRGLARLARDAALSSMRRRPHGDLVDLARPAIALRDRDPSRGRPSTRRVGTAVRVEHAAWERAATEHGGTVSSLQVAVCANLLRDARRRRGAPRDRPIRLIVPVDLADRSAAPRASATVGPVMLTSATVVLPGGEPRHGDLAPVRERLRLAVQAAVEDVRVTGRVPVAPGVVDAMRLLPDAVTSRVLFGVHAHYDGAVSSVGAVPPGMLRVGGHTASEAFLMAFPLGSDLALGFATDGTALTLGAVADPSRLAAGPPLRERVVSELGRWGLDAVAW